MDHPHVHGTKFQIVERERDGKTSPEPILAWKDTVNITAKETRNWMVVDSVSCEPVYLSITGIFPRKRQNNRGILQHVILCPAFPSTLIADEPTTALDATIEAQIVELLRDIRSDIRGSVILVSHSLGLVADLCEHVIVMYAGKVVETGRVDDVFSRPEHPYTEALLACEIDPWQTANSDAPLPRIPGAPPDLVQLPAGCVFAPRCSKRFEACSQPPPLKTLADARTVACWLR